MVVALGARGRAVPSSGGVLVRRALAHSLQERQLTQAPGARADVTLRHVCGRPGTQGLAATLRPAQLRPTQLAAPERFPRWEPLNESIAAAWGRFSATVEAGSPGKGRSPSLPTLPRGPTPTRTDSS